MTLPDLQALTVNDDRLCGRAADTGAVCDALRAGKRALEAVAAGDHRKVARMLGYCAEGTLRLGEEASAAVRIEEALAIAQQLGDDRLLLTNTIRLCELARSRGDTDTATRVLGDALCLSDASPDGYLRDFVLQHLGKALSNAGRPEEAVPLLEEALVLRHAIGSTALITSTEEALAVARGSVGV